MLYWVLDKEHQVIVILFRHFSCTFFQISYMEEDHLACLNTHTPPSDNILKVFLKDEAVSNTQSWTKNVLVNQIAEILYLYWSE